MSEWMPYAGCECCRCAVDIKFQQADNTQNKCGYRFSSYGAVYRRLDASGSLTQHCGGPINNGELPDGITETRTLSGFFEMTRRTCAQSGSVHIHVSNSYYGDSDFSPESPLSCYWLATFCADCSFTENTMSLVATLGPCGCSESNPYSHSGSFAVNLSAPYLTSEMIEDAILGLDFSDWDESVWGDWVYQSDEEPHLIGSGLVVDTGSELWASVTQGRFRFRFRPPGNGGHCLRVSWRLKQSNVDGSGADYLDAEVHEWRWDGELPDDFDLTDPTSYPMSDWQVVPIPTTHGKVIFPTDFEAICDGC